MIEFTAFITKVANNRFWSQNQTIMYVLSYQNEAKLSLKMDSNLYFCSWSQGC